MHKYLGIILLGAFVASPAIAGAIVSSKPEQFVATLNSKEVTRSLIIPVNGASNSSGGGGSANGTDTKMPKGFDARNTNDKSDTKSPAAGGASSGGGVKTPTDD